MMKETGLSRRSSLLSRRATAAAVGALLILSVVTGLVWASATGRLADLRYTNIPMVHPYPPPGYYVNPETGDPRDLISSAEATRVKADLIEDGQVALDALGRGDPAGLPRAAAGNYLATLTQNVVTNNSNGVVYRERHRLDLLTVGRIPDPNDPSVTVVVRERGTGTLSYVDKQTGRTVSGYDFRFDDRFWLVHSGRRYLITDAAINAVQGQVK